MSRVCEEFSCLPTAAVRELMTDPSGMALDILELRAYARTKEQIDQAKAEKDMPKGPMAQQVWLVQHELMQRRQEAE